MLEYANSSHSNLILEIKEKKKLSVREPRKVADIISKFVKEQNQKTEALYANIKDLKKTQSTQSTLKITTAMKLVSRLLNKAQQVIQGAKTHAIELDLNNKNGICSSRQL